MLTDNLGSCVSFLGMCVTLYDWYLKFVSVSTVSFAVEQDVLESGETFCVPLHTEA